MKDRSTCRLSSFQYKIDYQTLFARHSPAYVQLNLQQYCGLSTLWRRTHSRSFHDYILHLLHGVDTLQAEMQKDIFNAFSWMLHDGIIELKFAIPCKKLNDGDFHAKFGIFYSGDEALSYSGSINDSKHGFQNFETIMVFKTWAGTKDYVDVEKARFERIWTCQDDNLKIYTIPQAVKDRIFELRTADRPYSSVKRPEDKWAHQDKAVECFLKNKHGILAMATGTGKTITAIKIMNRLFNEEKIRRVVITMYGNDLLDQWATQISTRQSTSSFSRRS